MAHGSIVRDARSARLNGDESASRLYERCPAACDRLRIFHWEWISDGDQRHRDWVRRKRKPISQDRGINEAGLLEACAELARIVQRELHDRPSPLSLEEATELWHARVTYLNALIYLGGNKRAKRVEESVAPDGQPLAICLGTSAIQR
jgi:hypothetical protein